jgi:Na(+)-translocating NADH:ubiquinone oxidoreductase A subunit
MPGQAVLIPSPGAKVRAGDDFLTGKSCAWTLPAPIGGTVECDGAGVGIRGDGSPGYAPVPGHTREPWLLEREDLHSLAIRTGAGMLLGGTVPDPLACDGISHIIVNAVHTSPVSRKWSFGIYGDTGLAADGLRILRALFPRAGLALAVPKQAAATLPGELGELAEVRLLSDRYPQEHPALLARDMLGKRTSRLAPCKDQSILVVPVTDLVQLAEILARGRPFIDRIVCAGGPGISRPGWYRIRLGTPVSHILWHIGKSSPDGSWRAVAGNPLSGRAVASPDEPLSIRDLEFSVIADRNRRELLSFLAPRTDGDSYARITVSSVLPLLPRKLDTGLHGGVRPCIQCNYCDEVCPAGIYPFLIARHMLAGQPEQATRLAPESCIECGLCEYVCPSKLSVMDLVRQAGRALREGAET